MKRVEPGTVEWFERARHRCVDHLRALLSMKMAQDSISLMLRDWKTADPTTRAALHVACVIAYARPFQTAIIKSGKISYPTKHLKKVTGFDGELHAHILDLRHWLIAHGDYDVFPSTIYMQTSGDEKLPVTLGINVKGMIGIEGRDLAERYTQHLSTCVAAIESAPNRASTDLAEQARRHPSEFHKTHNIPEEVQELALGPLDSELPRPSGPAGNVEEPSFPNGLSGYRYITLTHQISVATSGKYMIKVHGMPTEIILA